VLKGGGGKEGEECGAYKKTPAERKSRGRLPQTARTEAPNQLAKKKGLAKGLGDIRRKKNQPLEKKTPRRIQKSLGRNETKGQKKHPSQRRPAEVQRNLRPTGKKSPKKGHVSRSNERT